MSDQEAAERLLVALGHPVRREMLARVMRQDEPSSPRALAEQLQMPLPNATYHARVLAECDGLELIDPRPEKGPIQHLYEPSKLTDHPKVKAALGLD